jgi:Flp pilus assembly protein TadG
MHGLSVMRLAKLARSNVDRQLLANGRSRENGAIAAIVGIFLGTGVLLGVGALVIDTGSLLYERRQLQSGADAAALSIAQSCAKDPLSTNCTNPFTPSTLPSTLVDLAGANAADGKSDIARVCASKALHDSNPTAFPDICTDWLATPAPPDPGLVECPRTSSTLNYVEVRTSTRTNSGTVLPPVLSQMLSGAGTQYSNTTVKACARAAWGPGTPPAPFPVTFNECEWNTDKGFQGLPPAGPGLGYGVTGNTTGNTVWPSAGSEVVLATAKKTIDCTSWNGHVAPGSFGNLDNLACNASPVDGWIQGNEGNPAPCSASVLHGMVGTVVYIPIFDCFTKTQGSFANCTDGKNHDWFHMQGYAPFYLTGFYFSGSGSAGNDIFPNSADYGSTPCSGSTRCISGWFTTAGVAGLIDTSGGPSFGTDAFQLAG